jgi:hypothetical protein
LNVFLTRYLVKNITKNTNNFCIIYRVRHANFNEHEIVLDETSTGVCSVKEETRGIGQWNSSVSNSSDYAVTVTVSDGFSQQSFTQIAAINGGPAKLQIKYIIQLMK